MGGIPIATAISLITGLSMVFVRKKAKDYGTRRIAEGMDIKNKELLVVEDVVTSGGQIILSVNELRQAGAIIKYAVCVIDREQGGKENLENAGIELIPLFTMSEIKNYSLK
jgi:orotate phosphoribosyltransferase